MKAKNYLMDSYFKNELFPVFGQSVHCVCYTVANHDRKYRPLPEYSDLCADVYNMIRACRVGNSGSYETLDAILDAVTDNIAFNLPNPEKFIQALLCYYILSTDDSYRARIEQVREDILDEFKEEDNDMGGKYELENKIKELEVTGWDEYYFNIARQVAVNSKCLSRKIGCVIVRDKSIIGSGYNSPSRGIPRCDERWDKDGLLFLENAPTTDVEGRCPRQVMNFKSGEGMEYCIASHAEESTITNCARMGVQTKGAIMYMTCGIPCQNCMTTIINAGVSELVVTNLDYYDKLSKFLVENSDVKIRKFDFLD